MSGIATMLAMIRLGLSDEQKLVLLAAIEEDRGPARSSSAERQRRYRLRQKERESVTGDVTPLHNGRDVTPPPYEDTSTPLSSEPKGSSEDTESARGPNPFPRPDWADRQHWKDFLANRKRKRLPNTATAYVGFLGDVARLTDEDWPPGKLLELAARKGWGSINKPDQDNRNGHARQPNLRGSRPSPALDMLKRAAAEEAAERGDQAAGGGTWPALPAIGAG